MSRDRLWRLGRQESERRRCSSSEVVVGVRDRIWPEHITSVGGVLGGGVRPEFRLSEGVVSPRANNEREPRCL
jgi:hypothetical protein